MPPTGLSGNNLARVLENANSSVLLPDTVSFYQQVHSPDGVGGTAINRQVIWSGACRFDPYRAPTDDVKAMRNTLIADYVVTLPITAPITNDLKALHNNFWYDIVQITDDQSMQIYKQVHLARINAGQLGNNG